jgi:hypothetical protein
MTDKKTDKNKTKDDKPRIVFTFKHNKAVQEGIDNIYNIGQNFMPEESKPSTFEEIKDYLQKLSSHIGLKAVGHLADKFALILTKLTGRSFGTVSELMFAVTDIIAPPGLQEEIAASEFEACCYRQIDNLLEYRIGLKDSYMSEKTERAVIALNTLIILSRGESAKDTRRLLSELVNQEFPKKISTREDKRLIHDTYKLRFIRPSAKSINDILIKQYPAICPDETTEEDRELETRFEQVFREIIKEKILSGEENKENDPRTANGQDKDPTPKTRRFGNKN